VVAADGKNVGTLVPVTLVGEAVYFTGGATGFPTGALQVGVPTGVPTGVSIGFCERDAGP